MFAGLIGLAGIAFAVFANSQTLDAGVNAGAVSISANGRYVAFREGPMGAASSIKVRDLNTGTTVRVSGSLYKVGRPRISRDGKFITFYGATGSKTILQPYVTQVNWSASPPTVASTLITTYKGGETPPAVSDDLGSNTARVIYIEYTLLISGDSTSLMYQDIVPGAAAGYASAITWDASIGHYIDGREPTITSDGTTVFFKSGGLIRVSNLSGVTSEIVSTGTSGTANADSREPSTSADGRYVAFGSQASNLDSSDLGGNYDVFVRDRTLGTTTRAYTTNTGAYAIGNYDSSGIEMSSDGTRVAFFSGANLISGYSYCSKMYLYIEQAAYISDWSAQTVEPVSYHTTGSTTCLLNGTYPSLSSGASTVGFESTTDGNATGDSSSVLNAIRRY